MKIAVCIPVYNFDVRPLVSSLRTQANALKKDIKIILIDDASAPNWSTINHELIPRVNQFIFLQENIGRSKIRNLFLHYTEADYLIYLDCDVQLPKNFLDNYLSFLEKNPSTQVIYGGRVITEARSPDNALRWDFGQKRENLPATERRKKPYLSFQSNNFMIDRKILENTTFDEKFAGYGYEDVIFGLQLQRAGKRVDHIHNPVISGPLDHNETFIEKSAQAARNLARYLPDDRALVRPIKLVSIYLWLKRIRLDSLIYRLIPVDGVLKNLKKKPGLRNLDLYKLTVLVHEIKKGRLG